MTRSQFALSVVLSLATSLPLTAQSVPRWSAELSAGRGDRSTRVGAVWYAGDGEDYLRAGLTVRLGSAGRIRPVVSADYSFGIRGDQVDVCGLAPNGTCFQYFPSTNGLAAGIGVRAMPWSRVTLGAAVGVARYGVNARYVDADAALGVTRRIHLLAHWRRLDWRGTGDEELWFQPMTFGVRVQP